MQGLQARTHARARHSKSLLASQPASQPTTQYAQEVAAPQGQVRSAVPGVSCSNSGRAAVASGAAVDSRRGRIPRTGVPAQGSARYGCDCECGPPQTASSVHAALQPSHLFTYCLKNNYFRRQCEPGAGSFELRCRQAYSGSAQRGNCPLLSAAGLRSATSPPSRDGPACSLRRCPACCTAGAALPPPPPALVSDALEDRRGM
jgi:hypothetical protein